MFSGMTLSDGDDEDNAPYNPINKRRYSIYCRSIPRLNKQIRLFKNGPRRPFKGQNGLFRWPYLTSTVNAFCRVRLRTRQKKLLGPNRSLSPQISNPEKSSFSAKIRYRKKTQLFPWASNLR